MFWFVGLSIGMLLSSILIGALETNWFSHYGLAIIILSSIFSITLAARNSMSAARASDLSYEDYLPKDDGKPSYTFKFTAGIMGMSNNQIKDIHNKIEELQRASIEDEKNFRSGLAIANYRIGICLAQIRFHEQATLPKMLGQGAGAIIIASFLTIIGSVYLAFPDKTYPVFSILAQKLFTLAMMSTS